MDVHVGGKSSLLGHGTVWFMGTDEGGQAGDGWMTWVKSGGHDWRNICRRTQETMTAAHEELSPNGN